MLLMKCARENVLRTRREGGGQHVFRRYRQDGLSDSAVPQGAHLNSLSCSRCLLARAAAFDVVSPRLVVRSPTPAVRLRTSTHVAGDFRVRPPARTAGLWSPGSQPTGARTRFRSFTASVSPLTLRSCSFRALTHRTLRGCGPCKTRRSGLQPGEHACTPETTRRLRANPLRGGRFVNKFTILHALCERRTIFRPDQVPSGGHNQCGSMD